MADLKKRKRRFRPRNSSMYVAVWTMNGSPMREEHQAALELLIDDFVMKADERYLHSIVRS